MSASFDGTLRLWDVASGKTVRVFTGHTESVNGCAFSPDGQQALSVGDDGMRLWNVASGQTVRVFDEGISLSVCVFSPNGQQVLNDWGRTLRLWDVASGETVHIFEGHTKGMDGCAFSPDGRRALSSSRDKTLRLRDVASGSELCRWTTDAELNCCAFGPDGETVIAGDNVGGFHFLSIATR